MDSTTNSLPLNDHDLLIKLDTKMDGLSTNLKDFQTNLITRVARTENRLDTIDIFHAGIPLKDYDSAYQWVQRIRANFWLLVGIGAVLTATIGALVNNLISSWLHL